MQNLNDLSYSKSNFYLNNEIVQIQVTPELMSDWEHFVIENSNSSHHWCFLNIQYINNILTLNNESKVYLYDESNTICSILRFVNAELLNVNCLHLVYNYASNTYFYGDYSVVFIASKNINIKDLVGNITLQTNDYFIEGNKCYILLTESNYKRIKKE